MAKKNPDEEAAVKKAKADLKKFEKELKATEKRIQDAVKKQNKTDSADEKLRKFLEDNQ